MLKKYILDHILAFSEPVYFCWINKSTRKHQWNKGATNEMKLLNLFEGRLTLIIFACFSRWPRSPPRGPRPPLAEFVFWRSLEFSLSAFLEGPFCEEAEAVALPAVCALPPRWPPLALAMVKSTKFWGKRIFGSFALHVEWATSESYDSVTIHYLQLLQESKRDNYFHSLTYCNFPE